eukprot:scaffold1817_cov250-Pinguiococcus_pyrenoidosus.AAC.9
MRCPRALDCCDRAKAATKLETLHGAKTAVSKRQEAAASRDSYGVLGRAILEAVPVRLHNLRLLLPAMH